MIYRFFQMDFRFVREPVSMGKFCNRAGEPMLARDLATEICESNRRTSHELAGRIRRRRRNVRTGVTERVRPGNGTGNYTYPGVPAL